MSANGKLLASELGLIAGTHQYVYKPLKKQTDALRQAFAHKFGKPLTVSGGYRSYEAQEAMFRSRYTTTYLEGRPYKIWNGVRWYQRPGTAMAAVPGQSNHGWGTAIDWGSGVNEYNSREHLWMKANAPRFGFRWPEEWALKAKEWWHFEDGAVVPVSNYVNFPGVVIDVNVPTPPSDLPEIDMLADERNMLFHIGALLDQTPDRTANKVWDRAVNRVEGHPSTIFNDLVEGNTASIEARAEVRALQAEVTALRAAVNALSLANGADPEDVAVVITKAVKDAVANAQFTAVTNINVVDS